MPSNPVQPASPGAVDRLSLGVESPRGPAPAVFGCTIPFCFETETSGGFYGVGICFEA